MSKIMSIILNGSSAIFNGVCDLAEGAYGISE